MAMRDPGPPGRNPFFDHGPDAELGDADPVADDIGGFEDALRAAGFDPDGWGAPPADDAPRAWPGGGGDRDPLGTLAALVDALQGAQPEATEHLITAAHELVLAVKTLVDATEAVLAAQRASVPRANPAPTSDLDDDPFRDEPPTSPPSGVRRIDLA